MENLVPGGLTTELTMLVCSAGLYFVWIMLAAGKAILENGAEVQAGPRDEVPEPSVFLKRARRLSANMAEWLLLFAVFVLTAHVAGIHTENTALGATLFLYARIAHGIIYLAGWPWIRPVAWLVSVIGLGMVAAAMM